MKILSIKMGGFRGHNDDLVGPTSSSRASKARQQ